MWKNRRGNSFDRSAHKREAFLLLWGCTLPTPKNSWIRLKTVKQPSPSQKPDNQEGSICTTQKGPGHTSRDNWDKAGQEPTRRQGLAQRTWGQLGQGLGLDG
ncbi:12096_t:CDS:2 [Funneliformis caledonium]|uniref:12096_t:CDS:1 n=1 Tax=Funneliformis caledonium TaxID=1117310 RepID=A0A9N9HPZ1_9GLOM|nr:12096_t:CDS:2 [Funneliformis caledonium]